MEKQKPIDVSDLSKRERKKKDAPSPIALEPCEGNRAAVLSLLVRLPTGETIQSSSLELRSLLFLIFFKEKNYP